MGLASKLARLVVVLLSSVHSTSCSVTVAVQVFVYCVVRLRRLCQAIQLQVICRSLQVLMLIVEICRTARTRCV
jgi:hypothetical protein